MSNTNKKIFNKRNLTVGIPLLTLAMVMGAFGGGITTNVMNTFSNLTTLAQNAFNSGYGCGSYGQFIDATTTNDSSPNYGGACTLAVVTSSSATTVSSSVSTTSSTTTTGGATISVSVNLSGNYNDTSDLMGTALKTANLIPLSQPYTSAPFNYAGTETTSNMPTNAVDWVLVQVTSSEIDKKIAAILTADSKIVDSVNGSSNLNLGNLATGSYKIIVRHRNHIAIATDSNINLVAGNNSVVDFTKNINVKSSNQLQVGTNSTGQATYGMYKGNVNGDTSISATDRNLVRNAQTAFGYYASDADLSGGISAADRNLVRNAQVTFESL